MNPEKFFPLLPKEKTTNQLLEEKLPWKIRSEIRNQISNYYEEIKNLINSARDRFSSLFNERKGMPSHLLLERLKRGLNRRIVILTLSLFPLITNTDTETPRKKTEYPYSKEKSRIETINEDFNIETKNPPFKIEINEEFNEELSPISQNKTTELCTYFLFLKENFPQILLKNEVGFVFDSGEDLSSLFIIGKACEVLRGFTCATFELQNFSKSLENFFQRVYFTEPKFKLEIPENLKIPEWICFTRYYDNEENNANTALTAEFTILNIANGKIFGQLRIVLDPRKTEDDNYIKSIYKSILFQIGKIKEKKPKIELPISPIPPEKREVKIYAHQTTRFNDFNERRLQKNAIKLLKGPVRIKIALNTKMKGAVSFLWEPTPEIISNPIEVDGKITGLSFWLPCDRNLMVLCNGKEITPAKEFPEENEVLYLIGDKSLYGVYGTATPISAEPTITIEFINRGETIGRFSFKQTPDWFIGSIPYKNIQNKKDSVSVFITDPDTLTIYNELGKKNVLESLKYCATGIVNIENLFNLKLREKEIRLGSYTTNPNAYFSLDKPNSVFVLGPLLEVLNKKPLENQKLAWRIIGQHETIHRLDACLGKDNFLSLSSRDFNEIYNRLYAEWIKKGSNNYNESLFGFIEEGNFFPDLKNIVGHPETNPQELFASIINTTISEPEKLKREFPNWPQKVQRDYFETIEIVINLLKKEGFDTNELENIVNQLKN